MFHQPGQCSGEAVSSSSRHRRRGGGRFAQPGPREAGVSLVQQRLAQCRSAHCRCCRMASNLWVSLLRESSKRAPVPEATCLLLGDKSSGKKALMEQLCTTACKAEDSSIVTYNYFDVEEGTYEFSTKVNLWSFGDCIVDRAFEIIGNATAQEKLLFFIVVDLSRPDDCLPSLQKWLTKVSQFIQRLDQSKQSKSNFLSYLKTVRSNKGNVFTHSETESEDFKNDFIGENFSRNIIVVGTKSDLLRSNDGVSARRSRELQGQLRSICLDIGAALVYSSTVAPTSDTPAPSLKDYVLHRLYPESLALQQGIEDALDSTFIPSGFDTLDMIKNASGLEVVFDYRSKFYQLRAAAAAAAEARVEESGSAEVAMVTNASDYHMDLEHEQEWLAGLQGFINQVSAAGIPTAPVPTPAVAVPAAAAGSMPSSKAPSDASLSTLGEETPSAANKDAEAKPAPKLTRRASANTNKPGDAKDATDFFKKMLESSNKK